VALFNILPSGENAHRPEYGGKHHPINQHPLSRDAREGDAKESKRQHGNEWGIPNDKGQ
jgi:hypothetical protein